MRREVATVQTLESKLVDGEIINEKIEAVHAELSRVAAALDIVAHGAENSDDDTLRGFCELLSDGINRAKLKLCDVDEAVDLMELALRKDRGRR